ncbi:AGC/PDK1 protein kinase [Panaeolus papilionaceus]|nr:AGC/PDK1 protein kinase [Panaeolus papilionaceus]
MSLADFELGEEVAWGSLATIIDVVYKRNNKHYALKVLNKAQLVKKKVIKSAHAEKDALISLGKKQTHHPGVVRLHHCFQDNTHLYFVLDLATNGDLKAQVLNLGSISLNCARYYIAQLVDAVLFLHDSGIAHRDIKPENILLNSEMRIMLADFGCAYTGDDLDTPRTNTFVGTAAYISPELLARSDSNPRSPDIWAIGCVLYFFLYATSPFMAATDYLTMKRVRSLDYVIPETCDAEALDLIQKILVLDPSKRLGVAPESSPAELRGHLFFVGRSGETPPEKPWSVINWEKLFVDPAPPLEVGAISRRTSEGPIIQLWNDFDASVPQSN